MKDFVYSKLDATLKRFGIQKIKNLELELLVSMEKDYYIGDSLLQFLFHIKNNLLNNKNIIKDNQNNSYKVDIIRIKICDSLNKHNLYYKFASEYMLKNNLSSEKQITLNDEKELRNKSYKIGVEQGTQWFRNNIDVINELVPKGHKIDKNIDISKDVTVLYEGDENNPKIELMRYDYFLKHPKYKPTFEALREVCALNNGDNIIERAFKNETNYFLTRVRRRNEEIKFPKFIEKQSYEYLFDEVVTFIFEHSEQNNLIEFYFGGREIAPTEVFRGKRAQSDPIIQKYLQGPLKGADQRKFVSVKMVEE